MDTVKTLNNIQKLSKIGKVLSRIVFIVMSLECRYGAELCEGKE